MNNSDFSYLQKSQILTEPLNEVEFYSKDWTKQFKIDSKGVLFPKTHNEVIKIVQECHDKNYALVPSGGRTGLSGGAVAHSGEWVLSLEKMNKIIKVSEADSTITVQAGVVTDDLQSEAKKYGLHFPVEFSATGSSQIGGNVATNAGGVHVVKYGSTRDWVRSLTVVTGTGETLNLNNGLVKNNTGYDLRHLFIGSEGTLGIITEIEIELAPIVNDKKVFLLGLKTLDSLLETFIYMKKNLPLSAFELFTAEALQHVIQKNSQLKTPLTEEPPYYILAEVESDEKNSDTFMSALEHLFEKEWAVDGVVSENTNQFKELWSYRELISESISSETPYKNDVSVKISEMPRFIETIYNTVFKKYKNLEVVVFGHIGDGNLHVNTLKPKDMEMKDFVEICEETNKELFREIKKIGGSISAEHGVGLLKKPYLNFTRSEAEINCMKSIKAIFDPKGILNPGKIF